MNMIEHISIVVYDSDHTKLTDFEELETSIEYVEKLGKSGCILDVGLFWGESGAMHNWSISSEYIKRMGDAHIELWISNYPKQ